VARDLDDPNRVRDVEHYLPDTTPAPAADQLQTSLRSTGYGQLRAAALATTNEAVALASTCTPT